MEESHLLEWTMECPFLFSVRRGYSVLTYCKERGKDERVDRGKKGCRLKRFNKSWENDEQRMV